MMLSVKRRAGEDLNETLTIQTYANSPYQSWTSGRSLPRPEFLTGHDKSLKP